MNKKRRVYVSYERIKEGLKLRKTSLTKMCKDCTLTYDTIRMALLKNEIMPDDLDTIARYLNIAPEYLCKQNPIQRIVVSDSNGNVIRESSNTDASKNPYWLHVPDVVREDGTKITIDEAFQYFVECRLGDINEFPFKTNRQYLELFDELGQTIDEFRCVKKDDDIEEFYRGHYLRKLVTLTDMLPSLLGETATEEEYNRYKEVLWEIARKMMKRS